VLNNQSVNRQPTLHEYSIYCCKLRLVEQDAIAYPIALCGPLNADFDGDTISVILVPEDAKEDTMAKMSPRVNKIYKKNLKNIFEFNHETLNGLANISEYTPDSPDDMKNPKYYYTDYAQLLKDVEVDGKIKAGTPIVFTGKLGGVDYQSKITTYGRLRISKIIEADLDEIKVGGKPVIGPYERINAKSAGRLMSYLYGYEDWVEKANKLQRLGLKYVTRTGVVPFDYSTLYANTDNDTYKEIRKIADSSELTDKQKLMLISEKYNGYLKTVENEFSSDLKAELDRAARVKLSSIIAINAPSFNKIEAQKRVLRKSFKLLEKKFISRQNCFNDYSKQR
jgi:DNA-directed RNA polymerase beta' subunit